MYDQNDEQETHTLMNNDNLQEVRSAEPGAKNEEYDPFQQITWSDEQQDALTNIWAELQDETLHQQKDNKEEAQS